MKFLQTHEGVYDSNPNSKLGVGNPTEIKTKDSKSDHQRQLNGQVPSNVVS